jgi:hypothetical protein
MVKSIDRGVAGAIEPIPRIEGVVSQVFVSFAMELVCPGLGYVLNLRAGVAAELSAEGIGDDLDFLDRRKVQWTVVAAAGSGS